MEEALQNLDEQLDQLGQPENWLTGGSLSDEAKEVLLPLVVEVARCYIQEERNTKFIEKGLAWARVALRIAPDHERAKLLEVDAIDKLDRKHVRPQPLGLAIDQLKGVLKKQKDEYGQIEDVSEKQFVNLYGRYCEQLEGLLNQSVRVAHAHAQKGDMKIVCDVREKSNISHVTPTKLKNLGVDEVESMTVSQVLSALRDRQDGSIDTPLAQKLKKFMCLVGDEQSTYSLDLLAAADVSKGGQAQLERPFADRADDNHAESRPSCPGRGRRRGERTRDSRRRGRCVGKLSRGDMTILNIC